jgi:hypothetical protein
MTIRTEDEAIARRDRIYDLVILIDELVIARLAAERDPERWYNDDAAAALRAKLEEMLP